MAQFLISSLETEKKLFLPGLPPPAECPDGTVYGNYSLKLPNGWRVIDVRRTVQYEGIRDTEPAFTRCLLRALPRRRSRQVQRDMLKICRPPQYCHPGEGAGDWFYVDIVAAYLSVYSRLTWDIEYLRGQFFSNNTDKLVWPFPREWKTGRSYVVTGCLPGTRRIVQSGRIVERAFRNPYENPSLVCAVWDILSAFGWYAVHEYGARYWNLDGGVLPERTADRFVDLLLSLGLDARVKYKGKPTVKNLGHWQIGEHHTKLYTADSNAHKIDAIPMDRTLADWVLDRFALTARTHGSRIEVPGDSQGEREVPNGGTQLVGRTDADGRDRAA